MSGFIIMAIGAAAITALLSRVLLIEPRVSKLVIPEVTPPLARRASRSRSAPARQQSPRGVGLRQPLRISWRWPEVRMPKLAFHLPTRARAASAPPAVPTDALQRVTAPTSRRLAARMRWRWPEVRMPKLAFRLPTRAKAKASAQQAATVSIPQPVTEPVSPPLPAWLADLDVKQVPPVDRRVWLCWLNANAYVGDRRDAFLALVEESDPELATVVRLARQTHRPLVIHTLEEAQRWGQQIETQNSSSAA